MTTASLPLASSRGAVLTEPSPAIATQSDIESAAPQAAPEGTSRADPMGVVHSGRSHRSSSSLRHSHGQELALWVTAPVFGPAAGGFRFHGASALDQSAGSRAVREERAASTGAVGSARRAASVGARGVVEVCARTSAGSGAARTKQRRMVSPGSIRATSRGTHVRGAIRLVLGGAFQARPARATVEPASRMALASRCVSTTADEGPSSRQNAPSVTGMAKPPSVAWSGRAVTIRWTRRWPGP